MANVVLQGVTKAYADGVTAIEDFSLEVRDGELLAVVGPSGCGKTSLLRLVAGLERVSRGEIWIADRRVTDVAPCDRNVAMMFQSPALYPHLSVHDNLTFGGRVRSGLRGFWRAATRSDDRDARVQTVAHGLGIESLLERRTWQLSGGERQRVALGRLLLQEADVRLLDEPLANLDRPLRRELQDEIQAAQRRSRTAMIVVTHDPAEAERLGDRIAVVHGGRLLQVGTPREIYERPASRDVALRSGEWGINLWPGRLSAEAGRLWFRGEPWALELCERGNQQEQEVELGVRPEDLTLTTERPVGIAGDATDPTISRHVVAGIVERVEFSGGRPMVHLEWTGHDPRNAASERRRRIMVQAGCGRNIKPGDVVFVTLDASRAHLFERRSGKNLKSVEKA